MYSEDMSESKGKLPARAYQQKTVFVVVNGISTGRYIAPFLRGQGYDAVIHLLTKGCEATKIPHNKEDYVLSIKESDFSSFEALLNSLSSYNIKAIIPGSESAVSFVDEMNHALRMPHQNEYKRSAARTDKYEMQEAMKNAGLKHARQIKASKRDTVLHWAKQENMYPIVVKPLSSAGSDGVHFCDDEREAKVAMDSLLGKPNVFGVINDSIVAQEKLIGDEFMVNTVSWGRDVYVVDIIAAHKITQDGNPLYDYTVNIPRNDKRFKRIEAYVSKALRAAGLRYGAAHTEVILTQGGPTLVEINARLVGTLDMSATRQALGQTHVTTLMNTYLDPDFLPLLIQRGQVKSKEGFALTSFFIAKKEVVIQRYVDTARIEGIYGYHSMKFGGKLGKKLAKTTDVFNMPGVVFFVGDTLEQVIQCHEEFRRIEQVFYRELEKPPIPSHAVFFTEKKKQPTFGSELAKQLLTRKNVAVTVGMTVLLCVLFRPSCVMDYVPGLRM